MSWRSPKNVIIVSTARMPIARDGEGLPIGRDHRSAYGCDQGRSERVFTCLYSARRGGIVRETEGIETLRPGKSLESTWSKP